MIKNKKSNKCFTMYRHENMVYEGEMQDCGNTTDDQSFFMRKKGDVLNSGTLKNENSSLCLDVNRTDPRNPFREAIVSECNNTPSFTLYQNGELVVDQSGWCFEWNNVSGLNQIWQFFCTGEENQMWLMITPKSFELPNYHYFMNSLAKQCMTVNNDNGTVYLKDCMDLPE